MPGFWPSKGVVSFFVTENTMAAGCAPTGGRRCAGERGGGGRDEHAKSWRWRDREQGREGVVARPRSCWGSGSGRGGSSVTCSSSPSAASACSSASPRSGRAAGPHYLLAMICRIFPSPSVIKGITTSGTWEGKRVTEC